MELKSVAFDKGKLAAAEGQDLSANPYTSDTEDFRLWNEGFAFVAKNNEDGEIPSDV